MKVQSIAPDLLNTFSALTGGKLPPQHCRQVARQNHMLDGPPSPAAEKVCQQASN